MNHWTTKPWGKLLILPTVIENGETHVLRVDRGGTCSVHSHKDKRNLFHVIEGSLHVLQLANGKWSRATVRNGETLIVECGVDHYFIAQIDTLCLEQYWITDIHRRQAF